jgi:hypothetical protein
MTTPVSPVLVFHSDQSLLFAWDTSGSNIAVSRHWDTLVAALDDWARRYSLRYEIVSPNGVVAAQIRDRIRIRHGLAEL